MCKYNKFYRIEYLLQFSCQEETLLYTFIHNFFEVKDLHIKKNFRNLQNFCIYRN